MKPITNKIVLVIFAMLAMFCQSASAQFETDGITATGNAKTEGNAEVIRMTLTVEAQGPDFKSAIEALVERKKKVMIRLEKLEAVEDSIKFGDVATGGGGDTSAMQQQMMRRFGDDPRMAKMMKVKPPVKVTSEVTAEWKLEGEAEALLVLCDELKKKITDADVGLAKEKAELSAEQEELAEEMAEMMSDYGGGEETPAGTPSFFYVRKVSQEDHDRLVGEAFADAKSKAERLAKATAFELGKVKMISSRQDSVSMAAAYNSYGYGGYGRQASIPQTGPTEDGTIEAVAQSPTNLPYSVDIAVAYEIKQ
jgi:hypothetical protein